ncbi:MAG: sulfatase-like hydrolase/transferase, partial [bacterium]|nr:sulfatase-like hydrolase/transferase [bacterium]
FVTNVNLSKSIGFAQGFLEHKEFFQIDPLTQSVTSDKIHEEIVTFLNAYLIEKDRKPLFLLVWSMDPHSPYTPLDSVKHLFDIERYSPIDTYDFKFVEHLWQGKIQPTTSQIEFIKTRYDQEIYFNDRSFGTLVDVMKSSGIYEDSLIMFTADHGEEFFEHSGVGHGRTLYNEQTRIPFVIKTPFIEVGERHDRMQLIDIYPTILDVLGIQEPYPLDGISLLNTNTLHRVLYFENEFGNNSLTALLDDEKKIIFNTRSYRPPLDREIPMIEVFDIYDLSEQNNLDFRGVDDEFRLQQLFSYQNREGTSGVEQTTADISPELDRKLKDLGYVK